MIISLVSYWTGSGSAEIQELGRDWLPADLDEIPVQIVSPEDQLMLDLGLLKRMISQQLLN